jgi:hypothetical protein
MRNGQNKRMRGRNRKSHNPLTRVYESNGPDVKIRGTASHVAEKYVQLARDAQSSGDPVAAENYLQHAEHYFRMIATAQDQMRQNQPFGYRQEAGGGMDARDDSFDEGDEEASGQPIIGDAEQPAFGTRDPQPYLPRDAQFFSPREQQYGGRQHGGGPRHDRNNDRGDRGERGDRGGDRGDRGDRAGNTDGNMDRLPSFITGSQAPTQPNHGHQANGQGHQNGTNGFDNQGGDRFPLHRRRRRHRGQRPDVPGAPQGDDES